MAVPQLADRPKAVGATVSRIAGASLRAFFVFLIILAPAFLLPGTAQSSREYSILFAVLGTTFTLFEYGSSYPGLVDFRYAPPYNRGRFLTGVAVLIGLVLLARASTGADSFSGAYLDFADRIVALLDVPGSPVHLVTGLLVGTADATEVQFLRRATSIGLGFSIAGVCFFGLLIWLFRWPQGREKFNLWINLPTFTPGTGREVERRLLWGGLANMVIGLCLPYLVAVASANGTGWLPPLPFDSPVTLIWLVTAWCFLPACLVIRGAALMKVGWLVRRARRF